MHISLSPGKVKMGSIPSVSLPSVITCRSCDCQTKCYAKKLERLRPNVRAAYQRNIDILNNDPVQYWREVEAAIMCSRFFRFHVSGDIPNDAYLEKMFEVAKRNPHCHILCFTKKFELVNDYIYKLYWDSIAGTTIHPAFGCEEIIAERFVPNNLRLIFSGWRGLTMFNPFRFPEAHVRYRDGTTTARDGAIDCPGNCADCAITDSGCWTLKPGEQVIFNEH